MLVFGGDAGGNVFLNDLYVFQFQGKGTRPSPPPRAALTRLAMQWCSARRPRWWATFLPTSASTPLRLWATSCAWSSRRSPRSRAARYIFGGYDGVECFNFLYVLQAGAWRRPLCRTVCERGADEAAEVLHPGGERFVWRKLNAGGDVPSRRAGHSAIAVGAKIFVFGGKDSVGAYLGDSYLLNVDTLTWSRAVPKPPSQVCRARAYHTTCRFGQHVYVFGGVEEGGAPSNDLWTWNVGALAPCAVRSVRSPALPVQTPINGRR